VLVKALGAVSHFSTLVRGHKKARRRFEKISIHACAPFYSTE
jgi:hypothetical protein